MAVIKDQKRFFDLNFRKRKLHSNGTFADFYSEEIARNGFKWLKDEKKILDYGCGDGASIDFYLDATKNSKVKIIGVDISGEAIKHVKIKYPQYRFYQIVHNTIPQIRDCSLDAVYLSHILHHAENHKEIFSEINK